MQIIPNYGVLRQANLKCMEPQYNYAVLSWSQLNPSIMLNPILPVKNGFARQNDDYIIHK